MRDTRAGVRRPSCRDSPWWIGRLSDLRDCYRTPDLRSVSRVRRGRGSRVQLLRQTKAYSILSFEDQCNACLISRLWDKLKACLVSSFLWQTHITFDIDLLRLRKIIFNIDLMRLTKSRFDIDLMRLRKNMFSIELNKINKISVVYDLCLCVCLWVCLYFFFLFWMLLLGYLSIYRLISNIRSWEWNI